MPRGGHGYKYAAGMRPPAMSTYVLIHGAWHGAWCWERVAPALRADGHRVVTPDLPGHGDDRTPTREVTLPAYVDRVCGILDAAPEPVVLVGHSMGGIVITEAAERRPEKVRNLVYVTAFLPRDGESLVDIASKDPEALVMPNLVMSEDKASATLRPEAVRDAFYGACSAEDAARAAARLVPQALAPFQTRVHTTSGGWGRVPRAYVGCLRDRAITPPVQRRMREASPCGQVATLDTDHSPFYSASGELVDRLIGLGGN